MAAWTGASPHINKSELMCKTDCGYYGNPAWDGYCSKCFKELLKKKQKRPVFDPTNLKNKVSRSVSDVTEFPSKATLLVSRKLDKQQLQIGKRTKIVKDIFRKSHTHKVQPSLLPQLNSDSEVVHDELQSHLKGICEDAHVGVSKRIKLFIEKISKVGSNTPLDDLGELFHEFYATLEDFVVSNSSLWRLKDEDIHKLKDLIEKYVTTRLYGILSTNVHAFCEEKDLSLQNRIRSLMWITCNHLECKIDENIEEVRNLFDEVINDLIEIDSRRTPSDKLSFLVSASNQILCLLKKSCSGTLASADDFLPALIYCILRANPPLLQSNICYVTNFALEASLQTGEAGYFFTNLCCAVSFIEKLTAESLCLTEAEFEHFMSGNALPSNALEETYMCDAFTKMKQNLVNIVTLENKVDLVFEGYSKLLCDFDDFYTSVSSEVKCVLERTPLSIRATKVNIDEPVPIQEFLPEPLQPQTINNDNWTFPKTKESIFSEDDDIKYHEKNPQIAPNLGSCSDHIKLPMTDCSAYESSSDYNVGSALMLTPLPLKCYQSTNLDGIQNNNVEIDTQSLITMNSSKTTSFTLQGETIQSIPCSTGLTSDPGISIQNTSSDPYSPNHFKSDPYSPSTFHNLPPPLLPLNSSPINVESISNKELDNS